MDIPFTKAHGTGNDFIILYSDDLKHIDLNPKIVKTIAQRRTGIGADGLLLLSPHKSLDFKMDYYNKDGTWETMCANGARCAVLYMYRRGLINKKCTFVTGDGDHRAQILEDNVVKIKMNTPYFKTDLIDVEGFSGIHVDSGAKHFVIPVTDGLSSINVMRSGQKIRYSPCFKPNGINVNFFEKTLKNTIEVKTYEKGIERPMLSCGSGSVASAFYASQIYNMSSPINIKVPGGVLVVSFDSSWNDVWIEGKAVLLFDSTLDTNHLG